MSEQNAEPVAVTELHLDETGELIGHGISERVDGGWVLHFVARDDLLDDTDDRKAEA